MKLLQSKFSRRLMVAGTVASTLASIGAARAATPRALALIGDRYHNPDYIRVSLDKVFHDLGIAIDYTIDYAGLSAASLSATRTFLIAVFSPSSKTTKVSPAQSLSFISSRVTTVP